MRSLLIVAASILEPSWAGSVAVLAAIITILVADVFFAIDAIAVIGLLAVSAYITLLIDVPWQWQILLLIAIWLGTTLLFYVGWRSLAKPISRALSPKIHETIESSVGSVCVYRQINGKSFAYWNGDLWPAVVDSNASISDGDEAQILANKNGQFHLKPNPK